MYEALLADLASDHRVVTWDARGTGESTPAGPYDMETDCSDLEAMLETARHPPRGDGRAATVLAIADGANRAVHVAAGRPELVAAVIAFGTGPLARVHLEGSEGMVASDAVVGAFIEMLERDYRGALRSLLSATNTQMSDAELRERVGRQISYCPQEPAAARVRAWAADDPTAASQETGERLWILSAPDVAGPWLPPEDQRRRLIETLTPKAHVEEGEAGAGPISQPGVSAATIRRITESLRLESSR